MAEPRTSIYLDSCATTPPRSGVVDAIVRAHATAWANPSSLHQPGLDAADLLERSRLRVASALNANPDDVIVTSGATESVHLALGGMACSRPPGRVVISAVEHPAVIAAAHQLKAQGWEVQTWPVDGLGRIRLDCLHSLLAPPTVLVSLIWGQSEVGTLQPIHTVGLACQQRGIPFHVDATQVLSQGCPDWAQLPVDLLSASSHKFGGPKGVGLLLARSALRGRLGPLLGGGGQEQGLRAGTQPVPLVAGMAAALEQSPRWTPADWSEESQDPLPAIAVLRDQWMDGLLQDPRLQLTGDPRWRLPHHISFLVSDHKGHPLSGRALVRELARRGIAVSSGSACSSGKDTGSPVLAAMQVAPSLQRSGLRLSLGSWVSPQHFPPLREALDEALAVVSDAS